MTIGACGEELKKRTRSLYTQIAHYLGQAGFCRSRAYIKQLEQRLPYLTTRFVHAKQAALWTGSLFCIHTCAKVSAIGAIHQREKAMKFKVVTVIAALGIASPCFASDDIDNLQNLVQTEFKNLSQDLGAALSYKAVSPAEPLGLTGFDIGLEVTGTELNHSNIWKKATTSGSGPSILPVPKLHLIKGLPLNFDVGVVYTKVPTTNISLLGGELRYAILEGGIASPAVAVRGTYTKLSGVDQLDLDTKGLELSISKGFAMLTPYAGIGEVWVDSKPKVANLTDESFQQTKYYAGVNLNLALMNFALEYDNTDSTNSYSVKLGWRF